MLCIAFVFYTGAKSLKVDKQGLKSTKHTPSFAGVCFVLFLISSGLLECFGQMYFETDVSYLTRVRLPKYNGYKKRVKRIFQAHLLYTIIFWALVKVFSSSRKHLI